MINLGAQHHTHNPDEKTPPLTLAPTLGYPPPLTVHPGTDGFGDEAAAGADGNAASRPTMAQAALLRLLVDVITPPERYSRCV